MSAYHSRRWDKLGKIDRVYVKGTFRDKIVVDRLLKYYMMFYSLASIVTFVFEMGWDGMKRLGKG